MCSEPKPPEPEKKDEKKPLTSPYVLYPEMEEGDEQ